MMIMMYACLSLVFFFLSVSFFPHKLCTVRVRTPYTVSVNDGPLLFPHRKKKTKHNTHVVFWFESSLAFISSRAPRPLPPILFIYTHAQDWGGGNVCRFQVVVTMMMWFLSGW